MSPAYIAMFRVASILILTSIFFRPTKTKPSSAKAKQYAIGSGVIYAICAVTSLYAIQVYGVVLTMLFLMLGPAIRYLAGQFILKEKVRRGEVLSSIMLTLVVALAAFIK
jgi:drug/metabolite transporter (DMT)-like permease